MVSITGSDHKQTCFWERFQPLNGTGSKKHDVLLYKWWYGCGVRGISFSRTCCSRKIIIVGAVMLTLPFVSAASLSLLDWLLSAHQAVYYSLQTVRINQIWVLGLCWVRFVGVSHVTDSVRPRCVKITSGHVTETWKWGSLELKDQFHMNWSALEISDVLQVDMTSYISAS